MSRSYRKPYVVEGYGSKHKRWRKRQASKAVRRYKGAIPNGKAYRKFYNPWDICDYKWYEDGKPSWYGIYRHEGSYEDALREAQQCRARLKRK